MSPDSPRDPRTHAIIGAAMEVHRRLGCGFLEGVYQEALAVEFEFRGIPFQREAAFGVLYRDRRLACAYQVDFVCQDVLVEVKALAALGTIEQAQVINYLKVTQLAVALLINFGAPSLEFKRMILTDGPSGGSEVFPQKAGPQISQITQRE